MPSCVLAHDLICSHFSLSFRGEFSVFPGRLFLYSVPNFSIVIVSLVRRVDSAIRVNGGVEVTKFTKVPFTKFTILGREFFQGAFPSGTIFTFHRSSLLENVVMDSNVGRVGFIAFLYSQDPFSAFSFPQVRKVRSEKVHCLCPIFPIRVNVTQDGDCSLRLSIMIFVTNYGVRRVTSFRLARFHVCNAPADPVSNQVRGQVHQVPSRVGTIVQCNVTSNVFLPVPMYLVGRVRLSVLRRHAKYAGSFLLVVDFKDEHSLTRLHPIRRVLALNGPGVPSKVEFPLRQQGKVMRRVTPLGVGRVQVFQVEGPSAKNVTMWRRKADEETL